MDLLQWQDCALTQSDGWTTIRRAGSAHGQYAVDWHDMGTLRLMLDARQIDDVQDIGGLCTFAQADADRRIRKARARRIKPPVQPTPSQILRAHSAIKRQKEYRKRMDQAPTDGRKGVKAVREPATGQEWPSVLALATDLGCAAGTLYVHLTTGAGQRTVYGRVFEYA